MSKVISIRLDDELSSQLDALAISLGWPKAWVIEQAIGHYVREQAWQAPAIKDALTEYRSGNASVVPHEEVMKRLETRINDKLSQ